MFRLHWVFLIPKEEEGWEEESISTAGEKDQDI